MSRRRTPTDGRRRTAVDKYGPGSRERASRLRAVGPDRAFPAPSGRRSPTFDVDPGTMAAVVGGFAALLVAIAHPTPTAVAVGAGAVGLALGRPAFERARAAVRSRRRVCIPGTELCLRPGRAEFRA